MAFHSRTGFTLIELLVVISIIMIMAGGALAGYRRFNDRQVIVTSGKELLVNLRQAQAKSTSGIKVISNPDCPATAKLAGFRVSGSGSSYTVEQVCQLAGVSTYSQSRQFQLSAGASFTVPFSVTFHGQLGGVTAHAPATTSLPVTIEIQPSATSAMTQRYRVIIDQSGLVSDGGLSP